VWYSVLLLQNAGKRRSGVFTIGVVGRCLSKALVQGEILDPKCKQLVLVAAPKDSRLYLQYPESSSALVQMVAELQRKAGLESVLVDPYKKSGSAVTVTGWVALACMLSIVVVAIWGMVLLYRRVTGADKPHTQYVKSGDA
jgi:Golgi apparatus protein 1